MATADSYGLFWNSDNGDRLYNADSFEKWLKKFFTSGVFEGDLQVTAASGMTVQIANGYCNIDGKVGLFESTNSVTLEAANSRYPRIDTIVIERSDIDRTIFIHGVTGSYSGDNPTPTEPEWDNVNGVYQIVLAEVYVGAGVSAINNANITDKRMDSSVCGYITGTVDEIDFTQIANQFTAFFEDFKDDQLADFATWSAGQEDAYETWIGTQEGAFELWSSTQEGNFADWKAGVEADFTSWELDQKTAYAQWFNTVKAQQIADKDAWDAWYANLQAELHNLPAQSAEYLQLEIDELREQGLTGSIIHVTTINTELIGRNVTVSNASGTEIKYGVFDSQGHAEVNGFQSVGQITISATDGRQTATDTVTVPYFGNYTFPIAFWAATVEIEGDMVMAGDTVTVKDSSDNVVDTIELNPSARGVFNAIEPDTYTFIISDGDNTATDTVVVSAETTYSVQLHYWAATVNIQGDVPDMGNAVVIVRDGNNRERARVVLDLAGQGTFIAPEASSYTFSVTNGTQSDSEVLVVTQEITYSVTLHYWAATVNVQGDAQMANDTVTVTDSNSQTVGEVELDSSSTGSFKAIAPDTYTFSISSGGDTASESVVVSAETTYNVALAYYTATLSVQGDPELYGATVTVKDSNDSTVGTFTLNAVSGQGTFDVHENDTYTLHATFRSTDYTTSVIVSQPTTYNVNFTINKATLNIQGDENLKGATVSIKKGSTVVGTVTLSSSTGAAAYKVYEQGTYTVTTTYDGDTIQESVNVNAWTTYSISLATLKIVSWASGTDAELAAMLDAHYAGKIDIHDYWAVGDERTVSLSAMAKGAVGETHVAQNVTMVLMNAGGKTLANGKTCAFVVGQKNFLVNGTTREGGYMNSSNTNTGGWKSSARRTWCNETYYNAIASGFKALLKQFINKSGTGGGSSSGTEDTTDWTALPAEVEVFGSTKYSVSGEGTQFKYYETSANRIKKAGNTGSSWWERSPATGNSIFFCLVAGDGNADGYNANEARGLAPFFCI